jgi:thiol:disulfide interchange protein DsbD
MVPILSGIIVGEGAGSQARPRFHVLALVYSLGMAIVYTALGTAAGLIGEGTCRQRCRILGYLSVFRAMLMIVLALSMFDIYQLQMPAVIQTRLYPGLRSAGRRQAVRRLRHGSDFGTDRRSHAWRRRLAGALIYISQTRDVVIGASALFAMAIGMSVPCTVARTVGRRLAAARR